MNRFFKKVYDYINPSVNPDIEPASKEWQKLVPTLWLLGKTGAGKSTIVQALTGDSRAEIGLGFQPCTQTASDYNYPTANPVVSFLDTRGLAEDNYDPKHDIEYCEGRSHALLVIMKAEEQDQSEVLQALKAIKKSKKIRHLLVVHTAINGISDEQERQRSITRHHNQVLDIWGINPDKLTEEQQLWYQPICVDLIPEIEQLEGLEQLQQALVAALPMLSLITEKNAHQTREEHNFSRLQTEILWYAGTAGASDAIPGIGIVTVPSIQGKMLHSLANQYGVTWNKQDYAEFIGMLGSGFLIQYLSKLGVNQLVKFIPVYGQTVGSTTAAVMSFSSTYAIGRAACMYLYHKSKGETVSKDQMKQAFEQAFKSVKNVATEQAKMEQKHHE
ncbi:TPA: YcjF family protein [Photobacterium damselae]